MTLCTLTGFLTLIWNPTHPHLKNSSPCGSLHADPVVGNNLPPIFPSPPDLSPNLRLKADYKRKQIGTGKNPRKGASVLRAKELGMCFSQTLVVCAPASASTCCVLRNAVPQQAQVSLCVALGVKTKDSYSSTELKPQPKGRCLVHCC